MASLSQISRRLDQIEAKRPANKIRNFRPGPDGVIPAEFNPETDRLIYRVLVTPGTMARQPYPASMTWRGQPFDPETIGG